MTGPLATAFQQDGWAVARAAFHADVIEGWRAECDRISRLPELFEPGNLRAHVVAREAQAADRVDPVSDLSAPFAALIADERVVEPVREVMGTEPSLVKDKLILKPPGADGYDLHQDAAYLPTAIRGSERAVIAVLAIDASDEASGCISIVPGCNRLLSPAGQPRDLTLSDVGPLGPPRPVPLDAGDILLFSALAPHRSGPNRSVASRRHLFLTYAPAHLGDQYATYYTAHRERLRAAAADPAARDN